MEATFRLVISILYDDSLVQYFLLQKRPNSFREVKKSLQNIADSVICGMNIRQPRQGSLNFNSKSHIATLRGCQDLLHYPSLGSIALNDSSRANNGFPCYILAVRSRE